MRLFFKVVLFLGLAFANFAVADLPDIDRTDKVHDRRYLDSINVNHRRPIRVNQVGFRPKDTKYAYVADPSDTKFKVIDAKSGAEAWKGSLSLVDQKAPKPNIWVNGAYNSMASVYEFGNPDSSTATEALYRADFSGFSPTKPGEYFVVVGKDSSSRFYIHASIYNAVAENVLQFFGAQRCGATKSWIHGMCHLKDGSEIGHDFTGGWHDCGDHFKSISMIGYAAYVLATTYLVYKDKAGDRYGDTYADTIPDGIPDILYEAKMGVDYIFKLYKASKADGLIEKGDMYHSVGVNSADHQFWDVPEKQDAQSRSKGGPDRHVAKGIGTASGIYIAALAYFAKGWSEFDPVYADSLVEAAKEIYAEVMKPQSPRTEKGVSSYTSVDELEGFYPGDLEEPQLIDDAAAAALALWYATKNPTYQFDLYKNTDINDNKVNFLNYKPADANPYFRAGYLGSESGFYPAGWMTDFNNVHSYVLFSFIKLILDDSNVAKTYGVGEAERDTLLQRATNALRLLAKDGSEGDVSIYENRLGRVTAEKPYNLVWTSTEEYFNRSNIGAVDAIFMLSEILPDDAEKEAYKNLVLDNLYYDLGANPWDMSFLMGAGDKNSNHPHNRAANSDGYNAGGMPYKYKCPKGALLGGRAPDRTFLEDWNKYRSTESCIDFSAQLLLPAVGLSESHAVDKVGPRFGDVAGIPMTDTSAIVSWDADEIAMVNVFYNTTPDVSTAKSVQQEKASKGGSVTLKDLVPGQTYYFFLEGMDTKKNLTTDDNHGYWYQFTMTPISTTIKGVTICQVDHRSAKIYWWSTDRLNGIVNFGKATGQYTSSVSANGGTVLFHEAELTGLEAGTTYYFTVSSGTATSEEYSFTTETHATYADFDIYLKPSSYGSDASCSNWQDCHAFILSIANNDTVQFENFEIRMYLKDPNLAALGNAHQNFGGDGQMGKAINVTFGTAQPDDFGGYYLPINVNGVLEVSGQLLIQIIFKDYSPSVKTVTYKDIKGSWSLRAHTDETDPEHFEGIDLTQALYFKGSETTFLETNSNGTKVVAFTRDPYVTVYYHGNHIYGYGPDYTPENGPQVNRTITTNFTSPFVSPIRSVERMDSLITFSATSNVSPNGILDAVEMNSIPYKFDYVSPARSDAITFGVTDTTLAYGNNYMEWVTWHNRNANQKNEKMYDCACAVMRTNVEIDTILPPPPPSSETRFLVFDKKTYETYLTKDSVRSMAEVHVKLVDSNSILLDTVNVELSLWASSSKDVFFWNSAAAKVPDSTVQLVNGEAVFYVSADKILTTTIYAEADSTPLAVYERAEAKLVVEEPPPWPVIDSAKMVDLNCDHVPDAFEILLSNGYQPGQSFKSIRYVYKGDTLESSDVKKLDGRELLVLANIKDSAVNTNPNGWISLVNLVDGKTEHHESVYQDAIPPTLLSISVLERLDTYTSDRVYMQFSEPISSPGTEWPVKLFAADSVKKAHAPSVKAVKLYNEALNVWEYEIGFGMFGLPVVKEKMFAQLLPGGIKDLNGNSVSECRPRKMRISLKVLPVPMTYASISDNDGDGSAEFVHIDFERKVDAKHYADSISLVFGLAEPETLWVKGNAPVYAADGMSADLTLKKPFSFGVTTGSYEGVLNKKNVSGAGLVVQHMGQGISYETTSVLAADLVGPMILKATVNKEKSDIEFLDFELSEHVKVKDSIRVYYRVKQNDYDRPVFRYQFDTHSFSKNRMTVTYEKGSEVAVDDGDSVHLQPYDFSALVDMNGNTPSPGSPWIPIAGNGDPGVDVKVTMRDVVANSGGEDLSPLPDADDMRLYILNLKTGELDLLEDGELVPAKIGPAELRGAVWQIDAIATGDVSDKSTAWDSIHVKYNLPIYSNMGIFVNRLSGSATIPTSPYISEFGKVVMFAEWANTEKGLVSSVNNAVATGAYIYKLHLNFKFFPREGLDEKTKKELFVKGSYDRTKIFGVRRVK